MHRTDLMIEHQTPSSNLYMLPSRRMRGLLNVPLRSSLQHSLVPLRRLGWLALALVVSCLSAAPAEAQTDAERAGARSAATAGADAFDAGKYQDALDLFLRAESV